VKTSRHDCTRRNACALTLIEVLVVIAIIAVLAAILLPAMAQAKARSLSLQCLSNLKQWNTAFHEYVHDNDDFIPREGFRDDGRVRPDRWADIRHEVSKDAWYNALPPYLDERPAKAYYSSRSGERPKFYENRIFHCPSAKFPRHVGEYNEAFFSLAMNSKLIQPPVSPTRSILHSSIQRPSDTATFLDARVSHDEVKVDPQQWDVDLGQPSTFASRFAARHSTGGNIAFADGRVAWMIGRSIVETRPGYWHGFAIHPDGDVIWGPDPLEDPNISE
jgi:prepilin-type N-terminal cleavage/methylation domain-containing protein/prepilin-type processing-associated H-X9-DG protein